MNALSISLRLATPALFPAVGNGDENSRRTAPYIPGSAIRGALIGRFQSEAPDLTLDTEAQRLFFSGQVRYLNAYPAWNKHTRALPVPASWRKHKRDDLSDAEISDFALDANRDHDQPIRKVFSQLPAPDDTADNQFAVLNPHQELAIHIASQERGSVRQGNSTVFQYQSLARDQRFSAIIVANDPKDLQKIQKLLSDPSLLLGGSRSAGYGCVIVEGMKEITAWEEFEEGDSEEVTLLTLLSDTFLRDSNGQPTHDLDSYLSQRLDRPIKASQAFIHPAVQSGFNRKWQLMLPQQPMLGMGSVFVYEASVLDADTLTNLVAAGIGERRVDGFGRIAVNWPAQPRIKLVAPQTSADSPSVTLSETSKQLAKTMAGRLLHKKLESHLLAQSQKVFVQGTITNYQLSRLRTILRQTINEQSNDVSVVTRFLNDLKPTARSQFERARVGRYGQKGRRPRLLNWIEERVDKCDGLFQIGINSSVVPMVAGQKSDSDVFEHQYTLRLIESVISGKMKSNRKEGDA